MAAIGCSKFPDLFLVNEDCKKPRYALVSEALFLYMPTVAFFKVSKYPLKHRNSAMYGVPSAYNSEDQSALILNY